MKYKDLYQNLRSKIENGDYPAGSLLPTEKDISAWGYSRNTVRQALALLEEEGLITKRRGSGSRVNERPNRREWNGCIALICPSSMDYLIPDMISGITEVFRGKANLMLCATGGQIEKEQEVLLDLEKRSIDGILVQGAMNGIRNPNVKYYRRFEEKGIPVVFLGEPYVNMEEAHCVANDNYEAGREAVRLLCERGCRMLSGIFVTDMQHSQIRYEGFVDACRERNLPCLSQNIAWLTQYQVGWGVQTDSGMIRGILRDSDGVVCCTDLYAREVVSILCQEGRGVPGDVAVVGFDNDISLNGGSVGISSFDGNFSEVGKQAALYMQRLLSGKKAENVLVPMRFVKRESC